MNTSFTPGEWQTTPTNAIWDMRGNIIASCATPMRLGSAEANASLIAAAPELYAALERLVAELTPCDDSMPQLGIDTYAAALFSARAAIAKVQA